MTPLTPVLSRFWDADEPWSLATYRAHDGYRALAKALTMTPDDVIALVKEAGEHQPQMRLGIAGAGPWEINAQPLALKRAFSNLVDNAVKYGTRARVALEKRADELVITIDDDGPGIPEAEFERVFDPFYRLEASRSRETGGTGLGLTVARSTIRAHGGDVRLANRSSAGLRVTITLPMPPHLHLPGNTS